MSIKLMKKTQLLTIQSKLNAPKNQRNNFGGFNYRSCEDILMAVKPLLEETNTSLTVSDEVVVLEGRFYIKATATLYDNETWEEIASTSAFAREQEDKKGMDQAQVTGASSSYARKYALNWLLCIDDNRDPDAQSPQVNHVEESLEGIMKAIGSCKTSTELSQIAPVITKVKPNLTAEDFATIKTAYNEKLKELK